MYKIRNKKNLRKRIFKVKENWEEEEQFKKWWKPDMKHVYFAMYSRHRSGYKKGDQLLNSYGRRNNRFLLTNYGFTIRSNKYNSLGFKVFVKYDSRGTDQNYFEKVIKMKKNKLSEELLQYLRANIIFTYRKQHGTPQNGQLRDILVSTPVDLDFEIKIVEMGLGLVYNILVTKYATTLEEDQELLKNQDLGWRKYLAVTHRTAQKELLLDQS